ncbi:GGDEF domain-containing protein [Escherichia coli]|nr:GGDEF domain-containing protein [Escherichia coli]
MEMYFKRMKDEWTGLVEQADPLIRAKAAEIALAHAHYLSIEFYRIVRIDPHAEEFLSNEQVERQLKSAMERWIINVLSAQVDDVERLIQIQHTVAEVHARIGIPVEIVEMGFRVLKKILYPVKEINDTWGHNTGDEILRKVSQAFYDNVRSSDYVFRYGGDEFIIVLTEASENETLRTAERIRSRVEKTKLKAANGEDIALSLSIGAAMFNGHPDYERLIQIADEALYIAKRRGRNRVELWKASL